MTRTSARLKVAVVGASMAKGADGRENFAIRAHVPALKALPDLFELEAVCTTRIESARETAAAYNVPHAFADVPAMLAALPQLDAVCISVRPPHHRAIALAALSADKHLYCERPMGQTTDEANAIHTEATKRGLKTALGLQTHFDPAARQMARLIADGYIGKPLSFHYGLFVSNLIVPRPSHRQWVFQKSVGGRPAFRSDLCLERIMAILNSDVLEICADISVKVPERRAIDSSATLKGDQPDTITYLMRLADGVSGTMQMSAAAWFGSGERLEVYGTEGMLLLTSTPRVTSGSKATTDGDTDKGRMKLYGARMSAEQYIANPIPPEHLQSGYAEIDPIANRRHRCRKAGRRSPWPRPGPHFTTRSSTARPSRPSSREAVKIHRIMDAAETAYTEKRWATVSYEHA